MKAIFGFQPQLEDYYTWTFSRKDQAVLEFLKYLSCPAKVFPSAVSKLSALSFSRYASVVQLSY
jgi:hypothetical protein